MYVYQREEGKEVCEKVRYSLFNVIFKIIGDITALIYSKVFRGAIAAGPKSRTQRVQEL